MRPKKQRVTRIILYELRNHCKIIERRVDKESGGNRGEGQEVLRKGEEAERQQMREEKVLAVHKGDRRQGGGRRLGEKGIAGYGRER